MLLTDYRKKQDITQKEAAEQLSVSRDVYCSWEYGIRMPRPDSLQKITEWSDGNVTANDFIENYKE